MRYFEHLGKKQQELLRTVGIFSDDDMPSQFFDKIKSLTQDLSEAEIYCVSDYYKPYCYEEKLDMTKLIGTDHDKYIGKSWIEAFSILSRGEEIADLYLKNPNYYKDENPDNIDMGLIEKDGNYYISSRCGGGNNRLITLKLLSIMSKINGQERITPFVRCRRVPTENTCENIFYCEFPNGNLTESGYTVRKTRPDNSEEYYDILYGPMFSNQVIFTNVFGPEILETVFQKRNDSNQPLKK